MSTRLYPLLFGFACFILAAVTAFAEPQRAEDVAHKYDLNLDSYMAYLVNQNQVIGHKDGRQILPYASVSKVLVTHWALQKLTHKFRFQIDMYMTPVRTKPGYWNLHLSSNRLPFFDARYMSRIFAHLKSNGIRYIQHLTFDEGVKYLPDAHSRHAVQGEEDVNYPFAETVVANIRTFRDKDVSVENVRYWPSKKRDPVKGFSVAATTRLHVIYSPELPTVLHVMNLHSNNHAANMIFGYLGGIDEFAKFAFRHYGTATKITMYNGSGGHLFVGGKKVYNSGPASAVVVALAFIESYARTTKIGLSHILALADPTEESTLQNSYAQRQILQGKLVAKTGSVFEAITLAGILSTRSGPLAFYFNVDTERMSDWRAARQEILAYLTGIMNKMGPGPDIR